MSRVSIKYIKLSTSSELWQPAPLQLCFVVLFFRCHDLSSTSKTAVCLLVWRAQIKTSCSEMIGLINTGILVYLFGSFPFFQDNSKSLLSYIVAYYLRHFDEVCFTSCLFESLLLFFPDLLRNPSRALFSSPPLPEDTVAYPLSNYLFSLSSFMVETNLSPSLALSSPFL